MKSFLRAGLGAMALLAVTSTAPAQNRAQGSLSCGMAYSVGAEDGSLLLLNHGEFRLVVVGPATKIHDGTGRSMTLADIRQGDAVEYWPEGRGGDVVASRISVNSHGRADCAAPAVLGRR
jgi:hypothetical protein